LLLLLLQADDHVISLLLLAAVAAEQQSSGSGSQSQAAASSTMSLYEETLQHFSAQLRRPDQQQAMVLPLAVAEANPALFQKHVIPFLDCSSKGALNASCQLGSKYARAAVSTITFCQSLDGTTIAEADPTLRYPVVEALQLQFCFRMRPFPSPDSFQLLHRVSGFGQLL
jgi:hypothetical protein